MSGKVDKILRRIAEGAARAGGETQYQIHKKTRNIRLQPSSTKANLKKLKKQAAELRKQDPDAYKAWLDIQQKIYLGELRAIS